MNNSEYLHRMQIRFEVDGSGRAPKKDVEHLN